MGCLADGVPVWFDEWEILHGDSLPAKTAEGPIGGKCFNVI